MSFITLEVLTKLQTIVKSTAFLCFILASVSLLAEGDTLLVSYINAERWVELNTHSTLLEADKKTSVQQFLSGTYPTATEEIKDRSYWMRFQLHNNLPDTQYIYVGSYFPNEILKLYRLQHGKVIQEKTSGFLSRFSERDLGRHPLHMEIMLPPGATQQWLFKMENITNRQPVVTTWLASESAFIADVDRFSPGYRKYMGLSMAFQGAVWIMILYMLLLYFQNNRDKIYITYAGYLFTVMLYLLFKLAGDGPYYFALPEAPLFRYTLNEPLQFAMAITYNVFAMRFLRIKEQKLWIYKAMYWINWVYAVYGTFITTYFIFTKDVLLVNALFGPTRLFMLVTGIGLIVVSAFLLKGPLVKYLVAGSAFFLLGNCVAIVLSIKGMGVLGYGWADGLGPISFTQFGVFLEILCFSLGIGKLIQISNREKEEIKDAYIEQLVQNEKLNIQVNQELEEKIAKRTNEVLQKSRELEEARSRQMKSDFERQLAESEMHSLRLQMNPHFIFNSLNSIRYFILKQDSDKAVDYITSFSKLLRMILHHSKQTEITLEEELKALRLYMMFESERFQEKFNYNIAIDAQIQPLATLIQPLLIQPFVENAIWHGLMHRTEAGHLLISIEKISESALKVIIKDDGIGREKAASLKSKSVGKDKSYGMQITQSRLEAMNKIAGGEAGFEVEDLYDEHGKAAGTKVTLIIKTRQYESANY